MKRKLLLLIALMAVGLSHTWAYDFSATDLSGQTLYYQIINSTTVQVTYPGASASSPWPNNYTKPTGSLTIPAHVTNSNQTYSVTSIGISAFYSCIGLTSVTIPNTVTNIGNSAFSNCSGLTSVTIPNSVTNMGNSAFSNCRGLTSVTIPNSVTNIGNSAFYNCSGLTSVTIPNLVTSIGYNTFENCRGLKNVTIPNSVTSIGSYAFSRCGGLTSITIPNSVTSIGNNAFSGCDKLSLIVPNSVTSIGNFAFTMVRLVDYCGTATGSPWGAHKVGCFFKDGDFIFEDYTQTTLLAYTGTGSIVNIPSSVTVIGDSAFFLNSDLSSVTIPNSVTAIGDSAFCGCRGLSDVSIPNSVETIGDYSFLNCIGLNSVTIGNAVTYIGDYAFSYCYDLSSVTIPNSVVTIGDNAFYFCSHITNVNIPNSVTTIGQNAFSGCNCLSSMTIGNSVVNIGDNAFDGCSSLTSVIVNDGNPLYDSRGGCDAIIETSTNTLILGCQNTTIPNSVTTIGQNAFLGCGRLTDVNIPKSVTTIGQNAFYGCYGLTDVNIPNSVTTIGNSAFSDCSGLLSMIIPNSVVSIGNDAFKYCNNLTVFNLTEISPFTRTSFGAVKRVVKCSNHGTGENAIHQIPSSYSVVTTADRYEYQIPASLIPDNFIYYSGSWKAKNIVLVDDTCRFFSPVAFTADNATYTRTFIDGNRSTLCLPFAIAIPEGLEVYEFSGYANNTIAFAKIEDGSIEAYTPYLVGKNLSKSTTKFTFSKQNADFPATPSPIATSTINGLTFHGTMRRECMNSTNYGYKDGYLVQSSAGTQGDHTSHAHVNPFRCFFTLSGNQSAPATLSVDTDGDYLGIDEVEGDMEQSSIRYSNDVYDMMGRLVRKDADNLRGLPRGIYIWRGKKQIIY